MEALAKHGRAEWELSKQNLMVQLGLQLLKPGPSTSKPTTQGTPCVRACDRRCSSCCASACTHTSPLLCPFVFVSPEPQALHASDRSAVRSADTPSAPGTSVARQLLDSAGTAAVKPYARAVNAVVAANAAGVSLIPESTLAKFEACSTDSVPSHSAALSSSSAAAAAAAAQRGAPSTKAWRLLKSALPGVGASASSPAMLDVKYGGGVMAHMHSTYLVYLQRAVALQAEAAQKGGAPDKLAMVQAFLKVRSLA